MTDQELQIVIKIISDGKGAEEAKEALRQLKKETDASGSSLQEAGKAGEEAGEKISEGAHLGHEQAHQLHAILRLLGPSLGEVGHIAHLAMFGEVVLGIGAAVVVAKELYEAFEKLKKPIEDFNAAMLKIDHARLDAATTSASNLATQIGEIARQEGNLEAAFARGGTLMEDRIKDYGRERDAILKVEEAKSAAYIADIDRQVEQGKISAEQGNALKENEKLRLDAERGATDQAKLLFEIRQREQQFEDARLRTVRVAGRLTDQEAVIAAKKAEAGPADAKAKADAELAYAQSRPITVAHGELSGYGLQDVTFANSDELKAGIEKSQQKIIEAKLESQPDEIVKKLEKELQARQQALSGHDAYIANLKKESDIAKVASDAAANKTKQANDQLTADEQLKVSGREKIDQLWKQYRLQEQTNTQTQSINAGANATRQATARDALAKKVAAGTATPAEITEYNRSVSSYDAAHLTGDAARTAALGAIEGDRNLVSGIDLTGLAKAAKQANSVAAIAKVNADLQGHVKELTDAFVVATALLSNHTNVIGDLRYDIAKAASDLARMTSRVQQIETSVGNH